MKQKELKRYRVMFTCLCSCAIHIEVAHSLDTDSFLLTVQSFMGITGNIWEMRSDNECAHLEKNYLNLQ